MVACTDAPVANVQQQRTPQLQPSQLLVTSRAPQNDEDYDDPTAVDLHRRAGAFSGAFVAEDGVVNVYVYGAVGHSTVRGAIEAQFREAGRPAPIVRLLPARYARTDLQRWKRSALQLHRDPGVVFTTIDERANRLLVGVLDSTAGARVDATVESLDIPREAVAVTVTRRPTTLQTLNERVNPVRGGLQIYGYAYRAQQWLCTYGVTVEYQAARHMVTASHCGGPPIGQWIGAYFYQPWDPETAEFKFGSEWNLFTRQIATEIQDVYVFDCGTGYPCINADALLARITYGTSSAGGVWRTSGGIQWWPATLGTTQIDPVNPKYDIEGVATALYQGDSVYKVGEISGATGGDIIDKCNDVTFRDPVSSTLYTLLCGGRARMFATGGDSGGPVLYRAYDGKSYLVGIVSSGDGRDFYWSNWNKIDYELGARVQTDLVVLR